MSKVITFSTRFPSYHPKAGQPTHFVEKILTSINEHWQNHASGYKYYDSLFYLNQFIGQDKVNSFYKSINQHNEFNQKHHTIRSGNRFKVGDKFSPRVWGNDVNPKSGRSGPYHSKQIIIAPDIKIKKVWDFEMDLNGVYSIDGKYILSGEFNEDEAVEIELAKNDGFRDPADMFNWFMPNYDKPKAFHGQIICWNENINY